MKVISDNLIHFLGKGKSPEEQLEIFKSIITDGLRLKKTEIKFGNSGSIHNSIVCFTDIPLSLCDDHTENYGKFGIGFKKSSIKRDGGHPARYFIDSFPNDNYKNDFRWSMQNNLVKQIGMILKLDNLKNTELFDNKGNKVLEKDFLDEWLTTQKTVLSFEQKTRELGPEKDKNEDGDKYFKEREWRLIPLNGTRFNSKKIKKVDEDHYYDFQRDDVNIIITPKEKIRIQVVNFLNSLDKRNSRLKEFSENPLPVIAYDNLQNW